MTVKPTVQKTLRIDLKVWEEEFRPYLQATGEAFQSWLVALGRREVAEFNEKHRHGS